MNIRCASEQLPGAQHESPDMLASQDLLQAASDKASTIQGCNFFASGVQGLVWLLNKGVPTCRVVQSWKLDSRLRIGIALIFLQRHEGSTLDIPETAFAAVSHNSFG